VEFLDRHTRRTSRTTPEPDFVKKCNFFSTKLVSERPGWLYNELKCPRYGLKTVFTEEIEDKTSFGRRDVKTLGPNRNRRVNVIFVRNKLM